MDQLELKVGTIINDNGKIGVITSIIENGVWKEMGPFSLHKNYEIKYFDGLVTLMPEKTMMKLIELGKIQVIAS
tara:strand:- start:353 stop:574 length:222 start_codon:yes stop_codon:yes gene_type:complete